MKKLQCLLTCALAILLCREVSVQANTLGKIAFIDQSSKLYVGKIGETPNEVPLSGLYNVNFPHWSPDAQWITFTANPQDNSTGAQVYVVHPDGTGFHRVTNGSGDLSCPSFSPGGSKILYSQVYGNLFTISVDGNNPTNLGVAGGLAEWSPEGTKISYTNWGWTYESDIFIYDTASQTSFQLTHHNPGEAFITATWAPDGTQLAISKLIYSDHKSDVCRINEDGNDLVNLTESLHTDESWPHWSPSGIFFHRDISGVYDIWLMSPDGSNLQNITNSPTLQELPLFDVITEPDPIQEILGFIEKSVADGTLVPVKEGKSGQGQLGALINMIEAAGNLIDANDPNLLADICGQLHAALGKTDGQDPPPDFVTGPAAPQLAAMIEEFMDSLGCE